MPDDSPMMIAANKAWNEQTTYAERRAFILVTLHNSREPETMTLAQEVMAKMEREIKRSRHS